MKKTYISPEVEVIRIEVAQMLAGSPDGFDGELDNDGSDGSCSLAPQFGFGF